MKKRYKDRYIIHAVISLQIIYFNIVLIAILIKAYRFSDLSILLVYMAIAIFISLRLTILYRIKLKAKGIHLEERLRNTILLQTPSTFMFILCVISILMTQYNFN